MINNFIVQGSRTIYSNLNSFPKIRFKTVGFQVGLLRKAGYLLKPWQLAGGFITENMNVGQVGSMGGETAALEQKAKIGDKSENIPNRNWYD